MNIHEHQAKKILMEFGAPVSKGIVILSGEDSKKEIIKLKSNEYVLKAQIHAGGRGKAGGGIRVASQKYDVIFAGKRRAFTVVTMSEP